MAESTEEFKLLLDRVRTGDENALMQLVEQNAALLQRAAQGMMGRALRPHLDSEDVVQSICRSLLIGYRLDKYAFSDQTTFIALAKTLLRRKIAHTWRRIKHEPSTFSDTLHDNLGYTWVSSSDVSSPNSELRDELAHILRHFDELDNRLVQLRLAGYNTADAAHELKIDPHFLRARLARLRKRLREQGLIRGWL